LCPFLADKGFTGKLAAKYISQNCPTSLIWAVAGRSQPKLTAVVTDIKALNTNRKDPDVIIADSNDLEALISLAQSTRVILSVVGPFAMYQPCVCTVTIVMEVNLFKHVLKTEPIMSTSLVKHLGIILVIWLTQDP
jgi:short subunit dehydrogenase-like uncharacterized protein